MQHEETKEDVDRRAMMGTRYDRRDYGEEEEEDLSDVKEATAPNECAAWITRQWR